MEVAVIIIRNGNGDFLVHKRSQLKKIYPGLFGLGAGGKLEIGESPLAAATRELKEETRIDQVPTFLFSFHFKDNFLNLRLHVFETCSNEIGEWDGQEWEWCGWMSAAKVDELAKADQLCPDTKVMLETYGGLHHSG